VLKKIITIDFAKTTIKKEVCLQWNKGKCILGGDRKIKESIWDIYSYCFDECDGEPDFKEVVRGNERIYFNCSFKNYNLALDKIIGEGYIIKDVSSFDRKM